MAAAIVADELINAMPQLTLAEEEEDPESANNEELPLQRSNEKPKKPQ